MQAGVKLAALQMQACASLLQAFIAIRDVILRVDSIFIIRRDLFFDTRYHLNDGN